MLSEDQIVSYNSWWSDPGWESTDPHLRRLGQAPITLPSPQVDEIDLTSEGVHILRGPRQVGKSTDLKLLVRRAISSGMGPRQVVYLSLDALERQPVAAVSECIGRALDLARTQSVARLLLLDEVTTVDRWQTAVKVLWDSGAIDRDVVVCTGSSAIDLVLGAAERLPGRRGSGKDFLVLPQSFAAFATTVENTPPGLGLTVGEMLSANGKEELLSARIHLPALQRAFDRYLTFGGLPAAVAEAAQGEPGPSERTRRILWDSLVKEVQQRGASIPATNALLERMMRSLGSKVSWSQMAKEMGVSLGRTGMTSTGRTDPRTLQSYVELLAANYFAIVLYFWRHDSGSGNVAKDKKIYFGDPLLEAITAERLSLTRDQHARIENAIALALYRRYEPAERSAENFVAPENLHVWGTRRGGEIDFVCGRRDSIEAVEVADWMSINRQKATAPMRALPNRPSIVATRNQLEFGTSANLVPAALLLWALSTN